MPRGTKPETAERGADRPRRRRQPKETSAPAGEKAARDSNSLELVAYEQFLELTTDGVWRYDVVPSVSIRLPEREQAEAILARAHLGFCNGAFARLHGFGSPEELIGTSLSDLLAGTNEEKVCLIADSAHTGYRFVNIEAATRGRAGCIVWTLNNVAGIVRRGRVVGGWGTSHDITDRKAAETALYEAHASLHATLAAFPDLVLEVDGDGRIYDFHAPDSDQFYEAPAAFLGKRIDEVIPPHAARIILDSLGDTVRHGTHPVARYALDYPHGRRWFDLSIVAKGKERGPDARYIAIARDVTVQETVSAALRASEERLTLALDATSDGLYDVDFRTGVTHYSPRYATMLGYEPDELTPSQETWEGLLHTEDREQAVRRLENCLAGRSDAYEMEFRLRTKSAAWRWILSRGKVVARDEDGKALRLVGTHRDITARVETRQALRASEEKYRLLVENASEAIFVAQDGFLKFSNRATARLLGRSPEDVASRPFPEFVHPEDRAMVIERHRRRLAGEDVQTGYAFRVLHASGSTRWVEINAVRIEWEGRPATLNFIDDITDRRTTEIAVLESEERFRRIFEESPMSMVTVGLDYRFTSANDAFCRMLGYTEEELLQKTFVDITHPDHVAGDVESVQRVTRGEIPLYRTEKRYVRKDGGIVWGALTVSAMRDAEGHVQYFLSMIEDVTMRKESDAALAESERRYRELANALPTCVFEADLRGRLSYANQTGLDWFGYSEDEIVGKKTVEEMVTEEERERAAQTFRQAAETGAVPAGEYTARRKDGSTFPALVSSRAMERDGQTVGVRGILIDITERVEAARRIERTLAGTIHALAVTTEMRDPYTAGHQERVTKLAVAIGQRMALAESRLEGLRVAGLLHDVGKVCVPAEILSKPSELTPIEFGLVRSHSEMGHAILRQIEFPGPVATIVLQHHERMDGSGYPLGLHGEEILLEARILAVADTVEAMASHRPYRAAVGIRDALAEITRGRGSVYDEGAVTACLEVFTELRFEFDR